MVITCVPRLTAGGQAVNTVSFARGRSVSLVMVVLHKVPVKSLFVQAQLLDGFHGDTGAGTRGGAGGTGPGLFSAAPPCVSFPP